MENDRNMTPQSTNIWDYKPAWCQPWSIISTGIVAIAGSWLILHTLWITLGVAIAIVLWWNYFLIIYPKAFAEYIASGQGEISNTDLNFSNK